MRLLWVENYAPFVRAIRVVLLAGHDLTVAPSLAAAREALAGGPFDAVLLDYDLDDGKGTELLPDIRRLAPRVPVIAASSHAAGNAALRAAGADAVCPKAQFARIGETLASACGGMSEE